jgi:RecG-like helicase
VSLKSWWQNLTATNQELEAEALVEGAIESGADVIKDVVDGQMTTLTGQVRSLVLRPEINVPALEIELFDGSGSVSVVWLGRRKIAGIEPGTSLAVTGRLVRQDAGLAMFNPQYAILPKGNHE